MKYKYICFKTWLTEQSETQVWISSFICVVTVRALYVVQD
jgi:hypothetical protein